MRVSNAIFIDRFLLALICCADSILCFSAILLSLFEIIISNALSSVSRSAIDLYDFGSE